MSDKELQVFLNIADQNLTGTLVLSGKNTLLSVHAKEPVFDLPDYVNCLCQDGQYASLLRCVSFGGGTSWAGNESVYNTRAFPHIVVMGSRYCTANEAIVESFSFHLSGAEDLFFDIDPWIDGEGYKPNDNPDSYTQTFSFSGSGVIFEANTDIGQISAFHAPTFTGPSMMGFSAKNQVRILITPTEPVSIDALIAVSNRFKHFAEVCTGQSQNIESISFISLERTGGDNPSSFEVIVSHNEEGERQDRDGGTYGHDMLAAPCLDRKNYEDLVVQWFSKNDSITSVALSRFSSNINAGSYYDFNRLVSAASLFEWFDSSEKVEMTDDIASVIQQTKIALNALSVSEQRDRLLGALGNAGKETLHQKIIRQLTGVLTILDRTKMIDREKTEDLISLAVKCRNGLVHGDYNKKVHRALDSHIYFLTETLEVLFACLCVHNKGYEIPQNKRHLAGHSRYSHFFKEFQKRARVVLDDING
tara:strand:+ start:519 stop:1946 length:1428 start_codon:yes stop_codon:yes gene_type:complete